MTEIEKLRCSCIVTAIVQIKRKGNGTYRHTVRIFSSDFFTLNFPPFEWKLFLVHEPHFELDLHFKFIKS